MKENRRASGGLPTGVLVGGLFLLSIGCGGSENAGAVSGTVRFKGQPLSEGSVSFIGENGQVATGIIDHSGRYAVDRVPVGSTKVTVQVVRADGPPPVSFAGAPTPAQGTAAEPKIPLRYSVPAASGLQHSVTKGKQQKDIELTE